jgi:hypothetical protein
MFTSCLHHVNIMFTSCLHHVYIMLTSCLHHVYIMVTSCLHQFIYNKHYIPRVEESSSINDDLSKVTTVIWDTSITILYVGCTLFVRFINNNVFGNATRVGTAIVVFLLCLNDFERFFDAKDLSQSIGIKIANVRSIPLKQVCSLKMPAAIITFFNVLYSAFSILLSLLYF